MIPQGWALLMFGHSSLSVRPLCPWHTRTSLRIQVLMNHQGLPPAWPVALLLLAGMILSAQRVTSVVFRPVNTKGGDVCGHLI